MPDYLRFTARPDACEKCKALDGTLYVPGEQPQYGPHYGCRCKFILVTHEHPEINARLDAIEERLAAIQEALLSITNDINPKGAPNQVGYFEDADHVIGNTNLTFDGEDEIDAADGPMTIATSELPVIDIDNSGGSPLIGFFGATPIEQPIATDFDELLTALVDLGLIAGVAEAPFPSTFVLDDFDRTEGPPPSGNWLTPWGIAGLVADSILKPDPLDAGDGAGVWDDDAIGPDAEIYVTVPHIAADMATYNVDGMIFKIGLDLQTDDPWTANGVYLEVYFSYVNRYSIYVNQRGTGYVGNTGYFTLAEGDKVGLRVQGSAVGAWRTIGGVWTKVVSGTLAGGTAAGYLGVVINRYHIHPDWFPCVHLDDMGGGTI